MSNPLRPKRKKRITLKMTKKVEGFLEGIPAVDIKQHGQVNSERKIA